MGIVLRYKGIALHSSLTVQDPFSNFRFTTCLILAVNAGAVIETVLQGVLPGDETTQLALRLHWAMPCKVHIKAD